MKRHPAVIVVLAVLLTYCGAYVALRASHRIMHYSNAAHPTPALRTPGHTVTSRGDQSPLIEWAFKPLMLLEELYYEAVG